MEGENNRPKWELQSSRLHQPLPNDPHLLRDLSLEIAASSLPKWFTSRFRHQNTKRKLEKIYIYFFLWFSSFEKHTLSSTENRKAKISAHWKRSRNRSARWKVQRLGVAKAFPVSVILGFLSAQFAATWFLSGRFLAVCQFLSAQLLETWYLSARFLETWFLSAQFLVKWFLSAQFPSTWFLSGRFLTVINSRQYESP